MDYFTNRTQHVRFNEAASRVLPFNVCVPPGSVLGPLLFYLIYGAWLSTVRWFCTLTIQHSLSLGNV